jgi:hypothetical protein
VPPNATGPVAGAVLKEEIWKGDVDVVTHGALKEKYRGSGVLKLGGWA